MKNAWELKRRLQLSFLSALPVSLSVSAEEYMRGHQEISRFLPGFELTLGHDVLISLS